VTFQSLQGPAGADGIASVRLPNLYRLGHIPVDLDVFAQGANGVPGDLYLLPDGRLFQLLNQSGSLSLVEVAQLVGPEGPRGSAGNSAPHTDVTHGGPWTFRAGNYQVLAHGPDPSTLTMVAFP
jgi:hypothetical protein